MFFLVNGDDVPSVAGVPIVVSVHVIAVASIPGVPVGAGIPAVTVRALGGILTVVGNPAIVGTIMTSYCCWCPCHCWLSSLYWSPCVCCQLFLSSLFVLVSLLFLVLPLIVNSLLLLPLLLASPLFLRGVPAVAYVPPEVAFPSVPYAPVIAGVHAVTDFSTFDSVSGHGERQQ